MDLNGQPALWGLKGIPMTLGPLFLGETGADEQKGGWITGPGRRISPTHLEQRGGVLFPAGRTAASDPTCNDLRQRGTAWGRKSVLLQVAETRCQQNQVELGH